MDIQFTNTVFREYAQSISKKERNLLYSKIKKTHSFKKALNQISSYTQVPLKRLGLEELKKHNCVNTFILKPRTRHKQEDVEIISSHSEKKKQDLKSSISNNSNSCASSKNSTENKLEHISNNLEISQNKTKHIDNNVLCTQKNIKTSRSSINLTSNLQSKEEDMNSAHKLMLIDLFDDDSSLKIAEHKMTSTSPVNLSSNVKKILADASRRKSLFHEKRNAKEDKKTDNKSRRKSIFEDYEEKKSEKSPKCTKNEERTSSHSSDKADKKKTCDEKTDKIKSDKDKTHPKDKDTKHKRTNEDTRKSETKHSNDKISTPKSSKSYNNKEKVFRHNSEDQISGNNQKLDDKRKSLDKDKTKTKPDQDKRSFDKHDNKDKNLPSRKSICEETFPIEKKKPLNNIPRRKSICIEQPPENSPKSRPSIQKQDTPTRRKSMSLEPTPKSRTPNEDKMKDNYSRRKSICVDKPSNIEESPKSRTKIEQKNPAKIFERRKTIGVTTPKKKETFSFFHAPPLRRTRSKSVCFIDDRSRKSKSKDKIISPTISRTKSINKKEDKFDDFIDDSELFRRSREKSMPPKLSRCKSIDKKDPTTPKKNLFDDRSQTKEKIVPSKRSRSKSIEKIDKIKRYRSSDIDKSKEKIEKIDPVKIFKSKFTDSVETSSDEDYPPKLCSIQGSRINFLEKLESAKRTKIELEQKSKSEHKRNDLERCKLADEKRTKSVDKIEKSKKRKTGSSKISSGKSVEKLNKNDKKMSPNNISETNKNLSPKKSRARLPKTMKLGTELESTIKPKEILERTSDLKLPNKQTSSSKEKSKETPKKLTERRKSKNIQKSISSETDDDSPVRHKRKLVASIPDSPKSDDSSSFLPKRRAITLSVDDLCLSPKLEINDESNDTIILGEDSISSIKSAISQPSTNTDSSDSTNEESVPEGRKSRLESLSDVNSRESSTSRQKPSTITFRRSSSKENDNRSSILQDSVEEKMEHLFESNERLRGKSPFSEANSRQSSTSDTLPSKISSQRRSTISFTDVERSSSTLSSRRSSSKENVSKAGSYTIPKKSTDPQDLSTNLEKNSEEIMEQMFDSNKRSKSPKKSKSPEKIKPSKIFPTSRAVARRISMEDTIPDPVINYGDLLKQMKNTTNKTIDFVAPLTTKTKVGFSKPTYDKDNVIDAMTYDSVIVIPEDQGCNKILVRRRSIQDIEQNTKKIIARRHSFHFEDMPMKEEEETDSEKTEKPKKAKEIRNRRKTINEFDLTKKPKKSILKKRVSEDLIPDTTSNQSITIDYSDIEKLFPSVSNDQMMTLEVSSVDDSSSSPKEETISSNKKGNKTRKNRLSSDSAFGEDIDIENLDNIIDTNLPDPGKLSNMPTIQQIVATENTIISKEQDQAVFSTKNYFVSLLFIYNRYYKEKLKTEAQKKTGLKPDITSKKNYFAKRHKSDMNKLYQKLIKINVKHFSLILFFNKMMTLLQQEFDNYKYITEIFILFFLRKTIWILMENFTSPSDETCLFNHITSCDAVDFLLAKEKFKHSQITEKDKFLMETYEDFSFCSSSNSAQTQNNAAIVTESNQHNLQNKRNLNEQNNKVTMLLNNETHVHTPQPVQISQNIYTTQNIHRNPQTYAVSNRPIGLQSAQNIVQTSTNQQNIPSNFVGTNSPNVALQSVPHVQTINNQYVGTNNVNIQNLYSNTLGTIQQKTPNIIQTGPGYTQNIRSNNVGTNQQPGKPQYVHSNTVGTNPQINAQFSPGNGQYVYSNPVQTQTQIIPDINSVGAKSLQNVPTIPVHNKTSSIYQNQFLQVRENIKKLQTRTNVQTNPQTNVPTSVQTTSNTQSPNVPTSREQNSVQTTSNLNVKTRFKQNMVQTKSKKLPNYEQAVQDLNKIKIIDVVVTKPKQQRPRIKLVDERKLKNSVPVENSLAHLICTTTHNNNAFGTLTNHNNQVMNLSNQNNSEIQQNNRILTMQGTIIEDQMVQKPSINAQNIQQMAQNPQQMAQNPQQMAQNPQQLAQNPQQIAQNPQQMAQNPQQMAQKTQNTQQMAQNRRYIRAPVQNIPVSPVQPNSRSDSEEPNIMAQMVQQYQLPTQHQLNDATIIRKLLSQQNTSRTGAPNGIPNRNDTYTDNQRLAIARNWLIMTQQQMAQKQIVPPQMVPPPQMVSSPQMVPNLTPALKPAQIPQQRHIPQMQPYQQMVTNELAPYLLPRLPTYSTQITNNFTINSNMAYNNNENIQQKEIYRPLTSANNTTQMAHHTNVLQPQMTEIYQNHISQQSTTNFGVPQQSYDMNSVSVTDRMSQPAKYRMRQAAILNQASSQNVHENQRDNQDHDQNTSLRNVSRDSGYFSPVDSTQNPDTDQFCERCLKPSSLMCSGCYTYYCSIVCQGLAWPQHEKRCFTRS